MTPIKTYPKTIMVPRQAVLEFRREISGLVPSQASEVIDVNFPDNVVTTQVCIALREIMNLYVGSPSILRSQIFVELMSTYQITKKSLEERRGRTQKAEA